MRTERERESTLVESHADGAWIKENNYVNNENHGPTTSTIIEYIYMNIHKEERERERDLQFVFERYSSK